MMWNELSITDKNELMKLYLKNGITSLSAMKEHYNNYATGGPIKFEKDTYYGFLPSINVTSNQVVRSRDYQQQVDNERNMYNDAMRHYNYGENWEDTIKKYPELQNYLKRIRQSEDDFKWYAKNRNYEFDQNERHRVYQWNKELRDEQEKHDNKFIQSVSHQNINDKKLSSILTQLLGIGFAGSTPILNTIGKTLSNPFIDAGLTVKGIYGIPENINSGIHNIKNGNYVNGTIDLGSSFLDIAGMGILGSKISKIGRNVGFKNIPKLASTNAEYAIRTNFGNYDNSRLQELRDRHFLILSGKSGIINGNKPIKMYHSHPTDVKFNKFSTNPEGKETFIYTHTNPTASHTYVKDDVEFLSLPSNYHNATKQEFDKALNKYFKRVDNNEFTKILYGKETNHIPLNGNGNLWNHIPIKTEDGYIRYLSTRDIEKLIMPYKNISGFTVYDLIDNGKEAANVSYLRHLGFDGKTPISKILKDKSWIGDVRAFRNPEDLKLSDAITYDDNNKIIQLWKRDDFNSKDIRY